MTKPLILILFGLGIPSLTLITTLTTMPVFANNQAFTLTVSPTSETVQKGSNGGFAITVTSTGYCGTVNLVATVSPNKPALNFRNYDIPVCKNSSGMTTLTVGTDLKTPTGTYTITITGKCITSGKDFGLTQTTTVTLTVT